MRSHTSEDNEQKIKNIKNNLMEQANKIFKMTNEKSIKTRYRFLSAEDRFSVFLATEYRLQKLTNVKARHFIAYAEYLKGKGVSAATIKTDIAGIRFFQIQNTAKHNKWRFGFRYCMW